VPASLIKGGLGAPNEAVFYQVSSQGQWWDMWLVVRTSREAGAMVSAVRREVRAVDPGVPLDRVGALAQALSASVAVPRFRSLLMDVFAATALLLAAIGIYSVIAYFVAQRTQEIGIRMALGATPPGVLGLVISQGGRLASVGIALVLAGAFALTRVLQNMLFGVTASDTVTFASAGLVLRAVSVVASLIPAWPHRSRYCTAPGIDTFKAPSQRARREAVAPNSCRSIDT